MTTDELVGKIRAALTEDLLSPAQRKLPRRTASAGHCYVASEVLWHLTGQRFTSWHIRHEANSHWFLRDELGNVIDPTADQFLTPPPYDSARRQAFLTRQPSRRAVLLIQRVQASPDSADILDRL